MGNNIFTKIMVSVVIVSMILQLFSTTIYAVESLTESTSTTEQSTVSEEQNSTIQEPSKEIKSEIIEKREENIKYFLLEDHTIQAAIYETPVHYMKDGKWEDIDNSLVETTDTESELSSQDNTSNLGLKLSESATDNNLLNENDTDSKLYSENKSNSFKVKFAKEVTEDNLVSIKNDKMDIKWSLLNAEKVQMQVKSNSANVKALSKNEEKTALKNITSTVIYSDIMKDVDITYDVISENVKENIILKSSSAVDNKFVFNLDVGESIPKLNEDKSISIYNTKNEEISKFDSPLMFDSNFEYSNDIEVTLNKDDKNYVMEIKPSVEWLKDEKRVYPITIDPTVTTPLNYQAIKDTYIYEGDSTNTTRYQAQIVRAGGGISRAYRSLIKFTLPTINSGDQIIDAQLQLCNYPDTDEWDPWTGPLQINVHKVTSDWQQETANWNTNSNINTFDSKIADYMMYQYDSNDPAKTNILNVTPIVKDWYLTGNNYGLMLKGNDETVTGHNEAYFLSADTYAATYMYFRPMVYITYRNQTGLEGYWSFHSQSLGRAGTSYVNDYNGNLVLTHGDAQTPGNLMPVSINHVYNTNDRLNEMGLKIGAGWRLNISQTVTKETIDSKEYAKYTDEDGTAHYFAKQGTTNTYLDEDGLGLTLTYDPGTTLFTMKDKGGNKSNFEERIVNGKSLWHLDRITDSNGNSTVIMFLSGYPNNFYIDQVIDQAGSIIKFNWSGGTLDTIVDQNNRVTDYNYDSKWNIDKITYPDGKDSKYEYNTDGLIKKVTNVDNSSVIYTYNPGMPYRVSSVTEYGTDGSAGNSITFKYGENVTTFTDNNNFSNTYSFTNSGHAVSISDFGNVSDNIDNAYGKMYKYGQSGGEKNKLTLDSKLMAPVINRLPNGSAELEQDWTYTSWGGGATGSYNNDSNTYYGNKALKIVKTVSSGTNFYSQNLDLEKGNTYTLSGFIKATDVKAEGANPGATLFIWYTKGTETIIKYSEFVTGNKDWDKYSITFDYPSDASWGVGIGVGITNTTGTAYFDGIQVEEGNAANTYNLIENSNFSNALTSWVRNGECNSTIDNVESGTFKFTGEVTKRKNILQEVRVKGNKGDVFSLSAWAKSNSTPIYGTRANNMTAGIHRLDGTIQWVDISINPDSSGWQYSSDEFIADSSYDFMYIYLTYYNCANDVYFDNICLYKDDIGQSYTYDKDGNVIASQDKAKQNSTIQYNGKNELLKQTDPKGGSFNYEYDYAIKNRLLSATNNSKINYSFEYDKFGNPTGTKIENKDKVSTDVNVGKVYYIRAKSSGMYLDVLDSKTTNGTWVQQYTFTGGANQQWKVYESADGEYKYLRPANADTMNLDTDPTTNYMTIYQPGAGDNQKWKVEKNADDSFKITVKLQETSNAVTIEGDSKSNNARVKQEKYENKENQSFYFEEVGVDNSENKSILESGEVFYLKSKSSGLYMDLEGSPNANADLDGVKLIQNSFSEAKTQLFRIVKNERGAYKIIPLSSNLGKAVSVAGGVNANNQPIQMYQYFDNFRGEEWTIEKGTDNLYYVKTRIAGTQRYLTVYNNQKTAGTTIVLGDKASDQSNQQWYLEPANMIDIEDGATYKIKTKVSDKYYAAAISTSSGADIIQTGDTYLRIPAKNKWKFVDLKNGYYKIVLQESSNPEMVLDVANDSVANGTRIQLLQYDASDIGQQWEISPMGNGIFTFKPRNSYGKSALDVTGASTLDLAKIQLWTSNGGGSLQYYIEKVSTPTNPYIESKASYTSDGRFVSTVTDARGKVTTNNYNYDTVDKTNWGTLSSVVDAKGNTTTYSYDKLHRMTEVKLTSGNKVYSNSYTYENDKLSSILHNGFSYNFAYDNFGNTQEVKVGIESLVKNTYDTRNGNLKEVTYGNDHKISYEYDRFSRVSTKTTMDGTYNYTYDTRENLASIKDNVNNVTYNYTYDLSGRLVKVKASNEFNLQYKYDNNSNINNTIYNFVSLSNVTNYFYDSDNKITSVKIDDDKYVMYNYDKLSRLQEKYLQIGANTFKTSMTYVNDASNSLKTTTMLESIKNENGPVISYTYDDNGNIETISKDGVLIQKYYYDALNQLVREDNIEINKTITYVYDLGGNIQEVKEYDYTTQQNLDGLNGVITKSYGYDGIWKDKLTSFKDNNLNDYTIQYDDIGNPLNLKDANNNNIVSYTWQNGRQLAKIVTNDGKDISYKYNDNGIRTQKIVNNETTDYYLDGDKVIYEKTGENTIYYTYDGESNLIGFKYIKKNGEEYIYEQYYYLRNGQGDITGILDNNLKNVVSYTYDAWGNLKSIKDANGIKVESNDIASIGNINPYRYRGYRYDNETGMYYLQSRYYNTDWDRFINADGIANGNENLIEFNMFAYCANNPVNKFDPSGSIIWDIIDVVSYLDSVKNAYTKPSWENVGWLVWDSMALLPLVPGSASLKVGLKVFVNIKTAKIGKQISSAISKIAKIFKTKFAKFASDALLNEHYYKHFREFGNISKNQYLKYAKKLINSSQGGNILVKIRSNGDKIVYNKLTNEFAVGSPQGYIRTYFKPKDGIQYFYRQ